MATLMIELPDELVTELREQEVSDKFIDLLVEQTIRAWLHKASEIRAKGDSLSSPFAESATAFAERLINENRELFEQLAKL